MSINQERDALTSSEPEVMSALRTHTESPAKILRVEDRLALRTLSPNIIWQLNRLSNITGLLRSLTSCKPTHGSPKESKQHNTERILSYETPRPEGGKVSDNAPQRQPCDSVKKSVKLSELRTIAGDSSRDTSRWTLTASRYNEYPRQHTIL